MTICIIIPKGMKAIPLLLDSSLTNKTHQHEVLLDRNGQLVNSGEYHKVYDSELGWQRFPVFIYLDADHVGKIPNKIDSVDKILSKFGIKSGGRTRRRRNKRKQTKYSSVTHL